MHHLSETLPTGFQGSQYRPLLVVAAAGSGGIVLDRLLWTPPVPHGLAWWSVAGVALGRKDRWQLAAMLLLVSTASVGGLWHHLRWNYFPRDDLGLFATDENQPVCVQAVALSQPKQRPAPSASPLRAIPLGPLSETLVQVERVRDGVAWRGAGGRCKLRIAGQLPDIQAGDRLLIFAKLGRQLPPMNPGQYNWRAKQRGEGLNSELFCTATACVSVLEPKTCRALQRWVDYFRQSCARWLARHVGPCESGLAAAVLLGSREVLNAEVTGAYYQTGTVHLLVVSGLHVGIVAMVVWSIARLGLLPRRRMALLCIAMVVIYAALVGGRPPVIRASVIVVLWLVSMMAGRRPSALNTLSAAALVVLAYNPTELFRGGTQLSFLSVAALVAYSRQLPRNRPLDPMKKLLMQYAPWHRKAARWALWGAWHLTVASAAVWIVTAPLVAYHFHILTPIGVVITPLVWPLISVALAAGVGTLTAGWLLPPLAMVLGKLCAIVLLILHWVVEMAQAVEFSHAFIPSPPLWWICILYAGLALFALNLRFRPGSLLPMPLGRLALAAMWAVWVVFGMWAATARPTARDQLRCTFLAVGHGTCVVMELPGGQTLLYDAGSLGSPEIASRTIASFLWSRGITHIDAIVLSHADVDHYNAVPGLIERFGVGAVYVSPMMFDALATDGQLRAPNYLRSFVTGRGIPLREVWMNDRLRIADERVKIEVLHPPREGVIGRDNANSIVLTVEFAGRRILLPGDLETPGLEAVIADLPQDCDVLLAPHHGSTHSDPPGFAAWCQPEWVVVSGRRRDAVLATTKSYSDQGARVLHTASQGAVRFVLTTDSLRELHYRSSSD